MNGKTALTLILSFGERGQSLTGSVKSDAIRAEFSHQTRCRERFSLSVPSAKRRIFSEQQSPALFQEPLRRSCTVLFQLSPLRFLLSGIRAITPPAGNLCFRLK